MKRFIAAERRGCTCPPELPVCVCGKTLGSRRSGPQPRTPTDRRSPPTHAPGAPSCAWRGGSRHEQRATAPPGDATTASASATSAGAACPSSRSTSKARTLAAWRGWDHSDRMRGDYGSGGRASDIGGAR